MITQERKNPTRTILEEGLCELEEGCRAIATSSGMSAIQLVFELFELNSDFLFLEIYMVEVLGILMT